MNEDKVEYRVQVSDKDTDTWKTQTVLKFGGYTLPAVTSDLVEALTFLSDCRARAKTYCSSNVYRILKAETTFEELDV